MTKGYRRRVNSKGQVMIPPELRERFGFKPGTEVVITERRGRLVVQQAKFADIFQLQGSLKGDLGLELLREERERERKRMKRLERL